MNKANQIAIVSIIASLLGVVATLGWNYYTEKSEITVNYGNVNSIIQTPTNIGDLKIIYKGSELEGLFYSIISVKNTGSIPIKKDVLAGPIEIQARPKEDIINASVSEKTPSDIDATISEQNNERILELPLLNPGDEVIITIITLSDNIEPKIKIRAIGFDVVHEKSEPKNEAEKSIELTWSTGWILLGLLLVFVAFVVVFENVIPQSRLKKKLAEGSFQLSKYDDKSTVINDLKKEIKEVFSNQKAELLADKLDMLPDSKNFGIENSDLIINELKKMIVKSDDAVFAAGAFAIGIICIIAGSALS